MSLELLFSAPALIDIANNIIASLLVDAGKLGVSLVTKKSQEDIYYNALKDCTEDFKPEVVKALREAFKTSRINEKVVAFQQSGEIIPESFFEKMFAPIVGKNSAPTYVKQFFANFRHRLAQEKSLAHEIQLFYQEILFIHSKKHDQETQKLLQQILESIKKPISIEATIGYQQIPPLPIEFVMPQAAIDRIKSKLEKKNAILIYGSPGAGKSVIATVLAEEAEKSGFPVFWFRFKPRLTDKNVLMNTLLQFLQQETGVQENNLVTLLDHSRALFVFDDMHYVNDKDLAGAVFTVSSFFLHSQNKNCMMLFTSREKSDFLPLHQMEWEHIQGLSNAEAETLVCEQYRLPINELQLKRAMEIFENHPQFLNFFKQWYDATQPDEAQVDKYLNHADEQDERLQDYLMRELYDALGKSRSNENKLLYAVAFFRIPENRSFIQQLYAELCGEDFSDTLNSLQKRKGLVKCLDDVQRYDIHDVLREFYYQRLDRKVEWHNYCAKLYKERSQFDPEVINHIEAAHHFRKSSNHEIAAEMLQPITHDCMVMGHYWQSLIHILSRLKLDQINDEELKFWTLYDRGNLNHKIGKNNSALKDFEQCLSILSQQDNYGTVFNSIGMVYQAKGDWDRAINHYRKSLEEKKKIEDIRGMAATYSNLGIVCKNKGEWNKAIDFFQKDLDICKKVNDEHSIAQIYVNLGIVYRLKGDLYKAINYYNKALAILEIANDIQGMAQTFGNIAIAIQDLRKWNDAIRFYQKSLEIFEKIGDIHGMAQIYNNLGLVHYNKGELDKAIDFFLKSKKIKDKLRDIHGLMQTYNNLGLVYKEKGEWDKVIEFYTMSIEGKEKLKDVHGLAHTYNNLGLAYQARGEWDNSIEFYQQSLKNKEILSDIHGKAKTYINIGNVHQLKGELNKAIEFYQKSLKDMEKVGDIHGIARIYGNLSLLYFEHKKYDVAISLIFDVYFLFAKLGSVAEVQQAGSILGMFQEQVGEKNFNKISDETLKKIFENGITWGRHRVVSKEEAREIWERLQQSE